MTAYRLKYIKGETHPNGLRFWVMGLVLVASSLGTISQARSASSREERHDLAIQARKACLSGDYQTGIAILTDLFIATKDPVMIFNQGRCFEQSSRYEEAITRFDEYLRITKNTDARDRRDAQEHIADCQSKLARDSALMPPPPPPDSNPPKPKTAAETSDLPPGVEAARPIDAGRSKRIAGIIVGSVGLVAVGTGVAMNLHANSLASDLNSPTGYDRDKASSHSLYKNLTYVGYGVGAACLVSGAVLYLLGSRAETEAPSIALRPLITPDLASLSLQGVF